MIYSINQIYIKNFKLFEDIPQPIVLGNKALTVLDGPNGFGKTSIFDVIELVLTGKLKRIKKSDSRAKYKELLFQNDKSTESVLKVEFSSNDGEDAFTLVKIIPLNFSTEKNLPDDFNIFETHLLDNFDDTPSTDTLVRESVENLIIDKFGVDISNIFNLVYYIEQEDNKYFLRMTESDRLNQISMLFNTDKEEAEVKRYKEIRTLVNKKKNALSTEINSIKDSIKELENQLEENEDNIEYFQLLPHLHTIVEWDKEDLKSITYETKEKYILDLTKLKQFIQNFESFEAQTYNSKINNYLGRSNLLEDFIIIKSKSIELDKIIELYQKQVNAFKIIENLSEDKFLMEWKNINFNELFNYFAENSPNIFSEGEKIKIENKIKELVEIEKNASTISESVRDLINIRESFINRFNGIYSHDDHDKDSIECPLCGEFRSSYSELITSFERKKRVFENMLDDTSNLIKESLTNLYDSVIKQLYTNGLEYFNSEDEHIISTNLYQQIIVSKKNEDYVNQLYNWFTTNNLSYEAIFDINDDYLDEKDLQTYSANLVELLESKLKHVEVNLSNQEITLFSSLYQQYFNKDADLVKGCSEDLIQKKIKYINLFYYNNVFLEKEKLNIKLSEAQKNYSTYGAIYNDLGVIVTEYNTQIKNYWKQIMKDIEIVFYIYSAKILQTHQRGTGIFLKESNSKIIRFITHPNKDHDVSNFMSSGQLSAIILALTLSLNKVYGNKGLSSLLIDDPLQTMDDINISSFIELLRNEFNDKQIILSTHEENVSSFMMYKFSTYKLNSQAINLKNEFYM